MVTLPHSTGFTAPQACAAASLWIGTQETCTGRALFINKLLEAAGSPSLAPWHAHVRHLSPDVQFIVCASQAHTLRQTWQKPRLCLSGNIHICIVCWRRVSLLHSPCSMLLRRSDSFSYALAPGARCCPETVLGIEQRHHATPALGQALRRVSIAPELGQQGQWRDAGSGGVGAGRRGQASASRGDDDDH